MLNVNNMNYSITYVQWNTNLKNVDELKYLLYKGMLFDINESLGKTTISFIFNEKQTKSTTFFLYLPLVQEPVYILIKYR